MYDVIVIGARCGGAPVAMLLARRGHRVLLVDRATFPSDTMSTHGIPFRGLAKLREWGLHRRLLATNCPPVEVITTDVDGFPLTGRLLPNGDLPGLICPRRTVLDKMLVDAAVEAGVELREGYVVHELLMDEGSAVGIRGASRGDALQTERAQIVIGADGKHSLVARSVEAPVYHAVPTLMCWYYTYWAGLTESPARFAVRSNDRHKVLSIPTNDGLTCVLVGWRIGEFDRVRGNVEGEYLAAVADVAPQLAERLEPSCRAERYVGTGDLPNFFRKPYGAGWALVGDAGYHKDPVNAQGISDALRDADLLAEAVDAGLTGALGWMEALAGYERRRNEAALPLYEINCRDASFTPPSPDELRLRAALRDGDPADVDALYSAVFGTIPYESFFRAENLARILGSVG